MCGLESSTVLVVQISTTLLVVRWAFVYSSSQQRQQGCDISLRGSRSRARFCTDVEAGIAREGI